MPLVISPAMFASANSRFNIVQGCTMLNERIPKKYWNRMATVRLPVSCTFGESNVNGRLMFSQLVIFNVDCEGINFKLMPSRELVLTRHLIA